MSLSRRRSNRSLSARSFFSLKRHQHFEHIQRTVCTNNLLLVLGFFFFLLLLLFVLIFFFKIFFFDLGGRGQDSGVEKENFCLWIRYYFIFFYFLFFYFLKNFLFLFYFLFFFFCNKKEKR